MIRAVASVTLPAANGVMIVTVREGQASAETDELNPPNMHARTPEATTDLRVLNCMDSRVFLAFGKADRRSRLRFVEQWRTNPPNWRDQAVSFKRNSHGYL